MAAEHLMASVDGDLHARRLESERVVVGIREPDGTVLRVAFQVVELEMLLAVARDSIIGGDGCGQWRASQARWDGQQWCCPRCGKAITFPF